jgi:DNA-binding beta-propeller fold protein YncE
MMAPLVLFVLAGATTVAPGAAVVATPEKLVIPDGEPGIGYDDLQYASGVKRILIPAGRTGRLVLLDPVTKQLTPIGGFSASSSFVGGHGEGTTSAVEIEGSPRLIVATDRGSRSLEVVDVKGKKIIASVKLTAAPDYVRFVPFTREVWVTEPGSKAIEVFRFDEGLADKLAVEGMITVPGGPESLVIDTLRGRAYTHTWTSKSYAIDIKSRKIAATWKNGCTRARGIALDQRRGLLFAGCAEGRAAVVDVKNGKLLSTAPTGTEVDSIGYSASLGHLYVPGGGTADLSMFSVSGDGKLSLLGKVATASDAHTAAFDPVTRTIFVGTPEHGVVLAIPDPFPSSIE